MPKIKFDVSSTDYGSAKDFESAPPGVYQAKIESCKPHKKKGERVATSLEVVYRPKKTRDGGKLEQNYGNIWDYIGLSESSEWKYAQFLEAIGVATEKKRKGEFNTDKAEGVTVLIRVKADKDQDGNYKPKVASVFPLPESSDEDDEDEELEDEEMEGEDSEDSDEESEDEDDEDADDEDEEDDDEDEEDEEDDEEEESEEDEEELPYDEWELADLRAEVVERGLLKKKEASKKKSATLARLLEENDSEEDDDDDDDDEPPF